MSNAEFDCIGPDGQDRLSFDGALIAVEITAPLTWVRYLHHQGQSPFPVARGLGQIDTGAAISAVEASVFSSLVIPPVFCEMVQTAHGLAELDRYNASVTFPQLSLPAQPLELVFGGHIRRTSEQGTDIIMLIGRDILRSMVFTYDGPTARFSIAT